MSIIEILVTRIVTLENFRLFLIIVFLGSTLAYFANAIVYCIRKAGIHNAEEFHHLQQSDKAVCWLIAIPWIASLIGMLCLVAI